MPIKGCCLNFLTMKQPIFIQSKKEKHPQNEENEQFAQNLRSGGIVYSYLDGDVVGPHSHQPNKNKSPQNDKIE